MDKDLKTQLLKSTNIPMCNKTRVWHRNNKPTIQFLLNTLEKGLKLKKDRHVFHSTPKESFVPESLGEMNTEGELFRSQVGRESKQW